MNRLYYCRGCRLRFQEKNFGHGFPERNVADRALCPYCSLEMEEAAGPEFPADWVEERPRSVLPDEKPN